MRKILEYGSLVILILLGCFHTFSTILFMRPFELDALMYVGAGFSFLFTVLLNFLRISEASRATIISSIISNAIISTYMVFILVEVSDLRALSVIGAMVCLLFFSIIDLKDESQVINS